MAPGAIDIRAIGSALFFGFAAAIMPCGAASAGANSVLIFDASNSMNSPFDGGSRLSALKAAISGALPASADELDLGLVVFGQREAQSCEDIQTLVPPGPGSTGGVASAASGVTAQGVSAVAQTLQHAADAVDHTDRAATIIAVADSSGVDNCVISTCDTAKRLAEEAVDLKIHVIGLAAKPDDVANLQCMATATGGEYIHATSRTALANALGRAFTLAASQEQQIAIPPPRPKPAPPVALSELTPRPKPDDAADGAPADGAGDVAGETPANGAPAPDAPGEQNVSVFAPTPSPPPAAAPETTATPEPALPNQIVIAPSGAEPPAPAPDPPNTSTFAPSAPTPPAAPPAAPTETAARDLDETPGQTAPQAPRGDGAAAPSDEFISSASLPAPSGSTILVKRSEGGAEVASAEPQQAAAPQAPAALAPAAPVPAPSAAAPPAPTPDPPAEPAGTGRVKLAAFVVPNTNAIPSNVAWQILGSDGTGTAREVVASSEQPSPEIELPSGQYFARATFGSATRAAPISVTPNETATLDLVLNAGGLQINPVNAGTEEPESGVVNTVYAAGTTARPVAENVASGEVIYLNAGVYRIESRYGGANAVAVADIEVQPGKLVKARINHRAGPAAFRLVAENGSQPLDGTVWKVLTSNDTVVSQFNEATPRQVFAEGAYDVVVEHAGKTYRASFEIRPGQATDVEVVAR